MVLCHPTQRKARRANTQRANLCFWCFLLLTPFLMTSSAEASATTHPIAKVTKKTSASCGLSKQAKRANRRLLLLAKLNNLRGITEGINWAARHPLLKRFDLNRTKQMLAFLQGRMVKLLGIQWQHGIWISIYDRGTQSKKLPQPYSWMPTHRKELNWARTTQAINRLEVTVEIRIKRSFWLTVAIKQLLNLSTLSNASENISGHKVYWLRSNKGLAASVIITSSRILLRPLWSNLGLNDSLKRQKRWQKDVQSAVDAHQQADFLQSKRRVESTFPQATQGILYLRPQAICHYLQPLRFPHKAHILKILASHDGFALGGQLSATDFQGHERIWYPSTTPSVPLRKAPPSIMKWLPLSTRWVTTLTGSLWPLSNVHSLLDTFPATRPKQRNFFAHHLQKELGKIIRAKGWAPSGSWLWSGQMERLWLSSLMYANTMSWVEEPSIYGDKRLPRGLFAMGETSALGKQLLSQAIDNIPGINKVQVYGQPTSYLFTQPNGKILALGWRANKWYTTNHPGLLQRLLKQAKKPAKGFFHKYLPTDSLVNLQGWNPRWNIAHINPSRLMCNWQPGLKDKAIKLIAKYIQHIEIASLQQIRHRRSSIRISWKQGGAILPKETYPSCWQGSPWWMQFGQNMWAIPLKSPVVQMFSPFIRIKRAKMAPSKK